MSAKEFLNRAYQLERKIRYKRAEINSMREIATAGGAITYDGMPKKPYPSGSPMENIVVKIVAMEEDLKAWYGELVGLKAEILDTISRIESEECRLLLQRRYLQYECWEDIWEDMCMSRSWVMKKHKEGLDAVEEIIKNNNS